MHLTKLLVLHDQLELDGTTCTFACPVFAHVQDQVISREQGYIAIEARTNVEVDQPECAAGCMPIDIGELNEELRQTAAHPLLLAYKFLQPSYELSLSVQRHGDVSVCVARECIEPPVLNHWCCFSFVYTACLPFFIFSC